MGIKFNGRELKTGSGNTIPPYLHCRDLSLDDAAFCHFSVEILWMKINGEECSSMGIFFYSFDLFDLDELMGCFPLILCAIGMGSALIMAHSIQGG